MHYLKILGIVIASFSFLNAQRSQFSLRVQNVSEYIAGKSRECFPNDLSFMDSVYTFAIKETDNDLPEALLVLTFSTIPYNKIPIQLPLLGLIIEYPIVSADQEVFLSKNENLPKQILFDSPLNEYGDKDKLAHFFGNAYIAYQSDIFDFGDVIGYFVEVFEENFKIQSKVDERDLHVNRLGKSFGEILKDNSEILPSQVLILNTLRYSRFQQ